MTYSTGVNKKCKHCLYFGTFEDAVKPDPRYCNQMGMQVYPNDNACNTWKQRLDKDQMDCNYNPAAAVPDKRPQYDDDQKIILYSAITECGGNLEAAIAKIIEWRPLDNRLTYMTKPKLQSFLKNHYEEMCQFVSSTKGLEVAFRLLDDPETPATVQRAIRKDIEDRGYGAPTQKIDATAVVISLSDLIKQREGEKETIPAGEWIKDDKSTDVEK